MPYSKSFKNIKFGDIDAKTEKMHAPKLLIEGFLDENGYINKIINDRFFLIYGLKGSGKTAIGSRIELIASDKNIHVEQYTLDSFNYSSFEGMSYDLLSEEGVTSRKKSGRRSSEIENNRSWENVLNVSLLNSFSKDTNLKSKGGKKSLKNMIGQLEELGVLPAEDLYQITKKISKKTLFGGIKMISLSQTTQTEKRLSYENMYDNLRQIVNDAILSKKHIIIIDGLDSVLTSRDVQKRVISGLLHATNTVNSELHKNSVSAKIVLLCRKDILDMLDDPNKQKIIKDFGVELDWYQQGIDYNGINLIKLLNLRAKVSLGEKVDIFEDFLPKKVANKETYKFILDHTRHIPRDIICLMCEIQSAYRQNMQDRQFYDAVNKYSADYFYGEVRDELVGIMDEEEIRIIFKLISEVQKYRMSIREIEIKAKELGVNLKKMDISHLLSLLYDIGAIGNVKRQGNEQYYSFKYRDRWSSFNENSEFVVHMALQRALKIRGGYDANDLEYD